MTDDELRFLLVQVFSHLKAQRGAISSLLAKVSALLESLCEIGPKYREIFDRHKIRTSKMLDHLPLKAFTYPTR